VAVDVQEAAPVRQPEADLARGVRGLWHPILRSCDLRDRPVGVTRLGEDLVLWRDDQGAARVFGDRCPHRGAKLSLGSLRDGALVCGYHGFEFGPAGGCLSVPVEGPESALAPRLRASTYPAEERWGLVWCYVGEVDEAPPPLCLPEELTSPEWSGFICEAHWPVNWLLIFENLADPMHGPFLHGRSHTLSRGRKADRLRLRPIEDGFVVERELQRGVNFDWSEVHLGGLAWFRIDIPYPWFAGPGGPLRILGFVTPVDDANSLVYFLRLRRSAGWRRALWRLLYRAFWERQHWKVIEQDRAMLESQRGLDSRRFEHLAQSDLGVVHLRRLLERKPERLAHSP
jgi:phenylpropionate dioxygenase-like ring-hydroxylating dioxygenase large terminal subunit